ncbi:MAG: hypothetical protein FWE28_01840 [Oscillospiraceae bacterium]|nr:hypothetical protein [Oscillospiraceae bacterium]
MKKRILVIVLFALMSVALVACAESTAIELTPQPEPMPVEADVPEEEPIPAADTLSDDLSDETEEPPGTYTIEQIQTALQPQFQVGDWGEGNPQVISAQRVDRDRDSIALDFSHTYIDLSDSVRYQVAIRFRQSIEDYNMWSDMWAGAERNPFSRDGDYTILTDYYYFNDVNGAPELAVVMC